MKYKLSIITINFNNLQGLMRTVESVINQTWKEFEYIIIDGGSTDGSGEYIIENQKYLNYWLSEPDNGIYNAMNKGIKISSGDYLLFLNSGDVLYDSNVLNDIYKFELGEDIIYGDLQFVSSNFSKIFNFPIKIKLEYLMFNFLGHPSTLIKSNLFLKYGLYDETFKIVSDWKFFLHIFSNKKIRYKKINRIVSIFYGDGISSNNSDLNIYERTKVLKNEFKCLYLIFRIKRRINFIRIFYLIRNRLKNC